MVEVNGYKMIKCIGEGSFGKVFLTKKKNDPNRVIRRPAGDDWF